MLPNLTQIVEGQDHIGCHPTAFEGFVTAEWLRCMQTPLL
jgi:hypothetical protein